MQLYIHRDGQQFGPYSIEQAREYLAAGNLHANDLAWHEGAADWVPLSQVEGVALTTTPPLPPAGAPIQAPPVQAAPRQPVPGMAAANIPATRGSSSGADPMKRLQRQIGLRNMGIGALFFIGGLAITFFSYEAASSGSGGGTYFVTWGAVIFGGIQFIKGLIQFCRA